VTCLNARLRSALSRIAGVLHFIPDAEDPAGIVEELADALAPDMYAGLVMTGRRGQMP
jgi:hypothetical protein